MKDVASVDDEPDSGYQRLESQIRWYDSRSGSAQRWYKVTKAFEILVGLAVPLIVFTSERWLAASLACLAVGLEVVQQVTQWHQNWITYRSTCEALRHEKYSYLGLSGPYEGLGKTESKRALVERVEGLISTEHSKWLSRQEYTKAVKAAELPAQSAT